MTATATLLQARRAYHALLRKYWDYLCERDAFEQADREICPELYDAHFQRDSLFQYTGGLLEDQLLRAVARAYHIEPAVLDEAMMHAQWDELMRQIGNGKLHPDRRLT